MKPFFFLLLFFFGSVLSAQKTKPEYATALIPPHLKENANAIVRLHKADVAISRRTITSKTFRVITILNEYGLKSLDAQEYRKIRSIAAVIYNSDGKEIKNIKRSDFKETAVSEGAIITDNKRTYLDYTPTEYPFTMVYESETSDSNTAFIAPWYPLPESFLGVEKSEIRISCDAGLGFKFKEYHFDGTAIKKEEFANGVAFSAENLPAVKGEQYSPSFRKFVPSVLFAVEKFHLEGIDGDATTWENFSAWNYNNLLVGTDEIPETTQVKIKALVGEEKDAMRKAKIIYQYVQDKTRYVSIQLGIGGWRPMKAKDVDRLGYGDCKALTNYTRALLHVVGVPSYYAVVYGDSQKRDLEPDFVSMQGNHVILAIPYNNTINWLECTSQTMPFGFQGDFTDDRMALLVKPIGGELIRTTKYIDNTQFSTGNYTLDANGTISGKIEIRSKGIQYNNRLSLERKSKDELLTFYKDYLSINNLKLNKMNVTNDREKTEMTENVALEAATYGNVTGDRLLFAVNAFNQYSKIPQRYRARSNPFEISRSFQDYDEITIVLPEGFAIEAKPEKMQFKDKFGEYAAELVVVAPNKLLYKRALQINEGYYESGDYENYRKFIENIARADNSKMVLIKK